MAAPLSAPVRVLIADDDVHTRTLVRDLCEGFGYQTLAARDGLEALELAAQRPDLVLLDVMMPEMDGYGVLTRLRANPATRDLPVIVLTAVSDVDGKLRGIELGADDYVTKPFRIGDLQKRIEAALERHRAVGERRAESPGRLDPLTGVGTYPQLKESLSRDVARAQDEGDRLAALLVSVDDYPLLVNAAGTDQANELLLALAQKLRGNFRETDRIFRIDDEAFVVLLPGTSCEGAVRAAERIVRELASEPLGPAGIPPLTASVGIAELTCIAAEKPDDLLRAAHRALEQARLRGPGSVEIAAASASE
jgi:diguanylate cyclase (GGDEF)-like protein